VHALFVDPGGVRRTWPIVARGMLPSGMDKPSASTRTTFEAQWHGLHARCLRFAAGVTPEPRKTRFRLVASLYPGGVDYPQDPYRRVLPLIKSWILLRQALPGAHPSGVGHAAHSGSLQPRDTPPAPIRQRRSGGSAETGLGRLHEVFGEAPSNPGLRAPLFTSAALEERGDRIQPPLRVGVAK